MLDQMQREMDEKNKVFKEKRKGRLKVETLALQKNFIERFKMFNGKMKDMLEQAQNDPLTFFKCNSKWPICVFHFTKVNVIPE